MIPLVFLTVLFGQSCYEIDEVVVTATRYPASLRDIAVATIVIDKEDIESLYPANLAEVLHANAGLEAKEYGSPGVVSGVFIRGVPSNGTLVLVNGQTLNYVNNGVADLGTIDVSSVERIEVIKGPVSSLYGADALGGIVNIITARIHEKPYVSCNLNSSATDLGSPMQTRKMFLRGGFPAGDASCDITGSYARSDGYRSNSEFEQYGFQSSLLYQGNNVDFDALCVYGDKTYGVPGPLPLIDSIHSVPLFGDSSATSLYDNGRDRVILGNMKANWHITDRVSWYNTAFADRKQTWFHTVYYDFFAADTVYSDYEYLTYTLGANTMLTVEYKNTKWAIGIDAHYDTLQTHELSDQPADTTWHAGSYTAGAWLECHSSFAGRITLSPSLRYDRNSEYGDFWSPGIGAVVAIGSNMWIKCSAGKTYRAPTFNDLFWPLGGNPDLKPEHSWAYELRFESSPAYYLYTAVSVFRRDVSERIFWLPGNDGTWQPQNVNELLISGVDVETKCTVSDFADISFDATYLRSKQKNNELVDAVNNITEEIERDAAFTPKVVLSPRVHLKLPYDITLGISGTYVSERVNYYADYSAYPAVSMATKTLESYCTANISLSKRFLKYLTLTFGVKNALDAEYATQFGDTIDDLDYPMPSRMYTATLTWRMD
jgi:outer membrane cobalamin receptor